jgi:hypothetical protein
MENHKGPVDSSELTQANSAAELDSGLQMVRSLQGTHKKTEY